MRLNVRKDMDRLKTEAKIKIDKEAEAIRMMFITPGDGQAMAYQQKQHEARLYIENPAIDPAEIPHIVKEAAMFEETLETRANLIIDMFCQWRTVSSTIEELRLAAKERVSACVHPSQIASAAVVDWSSVLPA